MPIYEYHCDGCGQRQSIFQRRIGVETAARCPQCGSGDLRRLISRFAVVRSTDDAFDDSALDGLDPEDPAAMERWARGMGEEMGSDFGDEGDLDEFGEE
jgi:putative FmdB family regulatory protein